MTDLRITAVSVPFMEVLALTAKVLIAVAVCAVLFAVLGAVVAGMFMTL